MLTVSKCLPGHIAGADRHLKNWQRKAFVHWLTTGFLFGKLRYETVKIRRRKYRRLKALMKGMALSFGKEQPIA